MLLSYGTQFETKFIYLFDYRKLLGLEKKKLTVDMLYAPVASNTYPWVSVTQEE